MQLHIYNILILILFNIFSHHLYANEWNINHSIDSMTDEELKTAYIQNKSGNIFSIYRLNKSGEVWANFKISEKSLDVVDWTKAPILRIDKNKPFDLSLLLQAQNDKTLRSMGLNFYEWSPKWVNFTLWSGRDEKISPTLKQIMSSNKIVFRYYLATGGYKETEFSLSGAKKSLMKSLDMN